MHTVVGWGDIHSRMGKCAQWDGEMYTVGKGDIHSGMGKCTQWDGKMYTVGW